MKRLEIFEEKYNSNVPKKQLIQDSVVLIGKFQLLKLNKEREKNIKKIFTEIFFNDCSIEIFKMIIIQIEKLSETLFKDSTSEIKIWITKLLEILAFNVKRDQKIEFFKNGLNLLLINADEINISSEELFEALDSTDLQCKHLLI